jgi:hypothetical protein
MTASWDMAMSEDDGPALSFTRAVLSRIHDADSRGELESGANEDCKESILMIQVRELENQELQDTIGVP